MLYLICSITVLAIIITKLFEDFLQVHAFTSYFFQMVDANQRWGVAEAVEWMIPLAKYNLTWIEEPTSPDDILGHARIAAVCVVLCYSSSEMKIIRYCCKLFLSFSYEFII